MSQKETEDQLPEDLVILLGEDDEGNLKGIRKKGETLSVGDFRPMEEGKPIQGELLSLKPRQDAPHICDVDVLYEPPAPASTGERKGPPKVATDEYRSGWERIFGAPN